MKRIATLLLALLFLLPAFGLAQSETEAAPPTQEALAVEAAVTAFLEAEMQNQAEETEDGWQRFLYEQGVAEITMNLDKFDVEKSKPLSVSFQMASGLPDVKKQPKYDGDAPEWLKGVAEAMTTHNTTVKTSLTITAADGEYTAEFAPKAEAALQKAVKNLATKARKAFADKTILSAITGYLMPTPIAIPKKAPKALDEASYQTAFINYIERNQLDLEGSPLMPALLYGLKGYKLDVTGGPEAFTLTYTAPDLDTLFEASSEELNKALVYDEKAKEYEAEELEQMVTAQIEKNMIAYRHGKASDQKESYSFNFFDLPEQVSPELFYSHAASTSLYVPLTKVQTTILLLPDYPALKNPKTGLISGQSSGTKCIFKTNKDGYSHSVSVYYSSTNQLYSTLFIANGKSTTVRIPQGTYYFIVGAGEVWYGGEYLFGNLGGYFKTENIDIASKKYYHTFTLNPKEGGNTDTYHLSYSDLFD